SATVPPAGLVERDRDLQRVREFRSRHPDRGRTECPSEKARMANRQRRLDLGRLAPVTETGWAVHNRPVWFQDSFGDAVARQPRRRRDSTAQGRATTDRLVAVGYRNGPH